MQGMLTFEEFTKTRYASLQKARAELYAQLRIIQQEIESIEKASRASGLRLHETEAKAASTALDVKPARSMTMKEAAVEILRRHPNGLMATEILLEMNKMLNAEYERSSLSPQLSRLKHDGIVFDVKGRWILVRNAPHDGNYELSSD